MKKEILISQESNELRIAVLESGALEEFYIERADALKVCGNIYKGIVKTIVPGIGAAFVQLGLEKDGFLYLEEDQLAEFEELQDESRANGFWGFSIFGKKKQKRKNERQNTNDEKLREGQEIVVQIVKEPIRNKGPRLTRRISIPARYMVLIPGRKELGISRRIEAQEERDRIRSIFKEIELPDDAGFIVRTAGEGKSKKEYVRDIKYLLNKWKQIRHDIPRAKAPQVIYEELDLVERVIRDNFTDDVNRIIVDDKEVQKKVQQFLKHYVPGFSGKVEYVGGRMPLFEQFKIEEEIERTYRRKVNLKCGGHIVIEQTESLVAIDVNSGRFTGDDNLEETAFRTNCEAAREIARQIRLRDVGGIIIIDFIDMERRDHRKEVYRILEEAVQRDRAKTNILQISKIGLVEMTRQRMRPSLESSVYENCPYCEGRGLVKSVVTMAISTLREIRKALVNHSNKTIEVKVHPAVSQLLLAEYKEQLKNLEKTHKSKIVILAQPHAHRQDINISI